MTGLARSPLRRLRDWLELIRFSHTVFALPFAVLAAVMAWTTPLPDGGSVTLRVRDVLGLLLCMVFARSAAMAFNRLVDHRWDARNPRTANRHLPAGIVSRAEVGGFTLACGAGFVASAALFLPNPLPLWLAIPVLLFLFGYSFAKRFTAAAHLWLGVALSLAPLCVWVALRGQAVVAEPADLTPALLLAVAVACWVAGFDIIYACQDAEFDAREGLHSVPARLGVAGALRVAAAFHLVMLGLLATLPWLPGSTPVGGLFGLGVAVVAVLVVRQHSLVRPGDLAQVNQAFFQTNAIISLLLMSLGIVDCLW